ILRFAPVVRVIRSKQRPRRIGICGSDGETRDFLLKGHEDLRQDERVMQLYRLVNALLAKAQRPGRHGGAPALRRYAVLPLSNSLGLIGWVRDCATVYQRVTDYRSRFGVPHDAEARYAARCAPEYDKLPAMGKHDVFSHTLRRARGEDLRRVLWLTSRDAGGWLDRRTRFTRSLAAHSVAGFVLGLGDRHLSNIMVDNASGDVVHIDFGDCFDVAMQRAVCPERVPFRLTQLLVNAMEASGVEGSFRLTCRAALAALRSDAPSLMALLEAVVYDPLHVWRKG
ncbi:kinase-like domain-containing protein, partial [Pelagophyceae sp. CCMP2097]